MDFIKKGENDDYSVNDFTQKYIKHDLKSATHMPVGLQLLSKNNQDEMLLQFANT
eukprot:CAMPEP_0116903232 /NCGR_PEP_ID=MMETSP0467-20121206/10603_1 /TAXON_ID=283647 /ORGANISM="Mesodinium pulex, Strain SPMC105" /LENGTH=54 /DNA_ID=CAMNT_0004577451 /DNA_START=1456 /DNA_END=1620 /DNA_ORIENTATION=-